MVHVRQTPTSGFHLILQAVRTMLFDDQNFSTIVSSEVFNGGEAYGVVRVATITAVWK